MLPFLTALDPRAAVKGSRDPLGFVPVWSRFGRRVVGNLTTVSNSVRGFTTLLLGYYFAEQAQERHASDVGSTLELFLAVEQLAAYCRYQNSNHTDGKFRGIEQVAERLTNASTVQIGRAQQHQILSNQKIYGLWGLFSVPARNSGLLTDDGRLTPPAREHVEQVLLKTLASKDARAASAIVEILRQPSFTLQLEGRHAGLAAAVAHVLRPKLSKAERDFYRRHLVHETERNATSGKQQQLATLLAGDGASDFDAEHLQRTIAQAQRKGWSELEADLVAIAALEPLLVACEELFALLCSSDGESVDSVSDGLCGCWKSGLGFLKLEELQRQRPMVQAAYNDAKLADRLLSTAEALATGDYASAIKSLLDQNAAIMSNRHGVDAWVRLDGGKLKVNFLEDAGPPSKRDEVPRIWRNTYFINSLKRVARTVEVA